MGSLAALLRSPAFVGTFQVLRLLPSVSAGRTALLAALTLVLAALPIGTTILMGLLVGSIPAAAGDGLASEAGERTLRLLGGIAALAVAVRILAPLQSTLAGTFARRVNRQLQDRVMAAIGRPAGIGHLEDPAILDLIKNAQGVLTDGIRPGHAVTALATLIPSWLHAISAACVLLVMSPPLGAAWLVFWPVTLAFLMREYVRVGQA